MPLLAVALWAIFFLQKEESQYEVPVSSFCSPSYDRTSWVLPVRPLTQQSLVFPITGKEQALADHGEEDPKDEGRC